MVLPWIEPIRPIRRTTAFDDSDWIFELKYDGFRVLLYIEPGNARFMSRNGKHMARLSSPKTSPGSAGQMMRSSTGNSCASTKLAGRSSTNFSSAMARPITLPLISCGST
jgi:ATP dependent DNA ligase domain